MPAIKKHYNLLFVGLLDTDQKGLGLLLEALALIRNNNQVEIQLNVVGDGLLRAVYEARAQALGLADRVSFLGLMPQREIADLLLESHALVQPSLHESQGVVIIEALASGRPVISTRCGGPEYMVNESNGIIVEPGQAEPLADAMVELLTHLERYNPFQIAREAAEKYSYEAVTAALTRVYEKVLSRKT